LRRKEEDLSSAQNELMLQICRQRVEKDLSSYLESLLRSYRGVGTLKNQHEYISQKIKKLEAQCDDREHRIQAIELELCRLSHSLTFYA
jgi:hypothetical protein